jgi:hypothetical protein
VAVIRLLWLGLILVAGCFEQAPADGSLKCAAAPAQACPGGYYCADNGTCWRNGRTPDLSVMIDGGADGSSAHDDLSMPDASMTLDAGIPDLQCVNLQCQQTACDGAATSVTGTVYTPSGKLPLPGVVVYVPNQTPDPLPNGISSGSCPACYATVTGSPVTLAISDVNGNFTLSNVPAGDNVPLVMQVGRWRRQVTLSHVAPCVQTLVDPSLTHLPRNRTEGDIPHIAVTTSSADEPECLLRAAGIDDSEFVRVGDPGGRIHIYKGSVNGGTAVVPDGGVDAGATDLDLWHDGTRWGSYDLMIFACIGGLTTKSAAEMANFSGYTDSGGRVFLTHYGGEWLVSPSEYQSVATVNLVPTSTGTPLLTNVDTSFGGGAQLAQWLDAQIDGGQPYQQQLWRHDVPAVSSSAQRWLYGTTPSPTPGPTVQQFSFDTPLSGQQCGHVVYSDFHVYAPFTAARFPGECAPPAVDPAGEAELIFMLFNQPTCVP